MSQTLGDLVGHSLEEDFLSFDLTEIQDLLKNLQITDPIDLAHAELLQQQCLRGADIISEYLGRIVKTVTYLENKIENVKNKAALEYKDPDGGKVTVEMRRWASAFSPEVEKLQVQLAKAKGSKSFLEKKHSVLISSHYHYKEISAGLRKTILGYSVPIEKEKVPEGWE